MSERGWFDAEAIEDERMSADMEQAELEAAGRDASRAFRRMRAKLAAGDKAGAAAACKHGWGYPLKSFAAQDCQDPRAGQAGYRCLNCGSALSGDPFEGRVEVIDPCELPPRA